LSRAFFFGERRRLTLIGEAVNLFNIAIPATASR
jgi:hypothetical protein